MHTPDPVEAILARLMPPALSEAGQREMEAMLDELAGFPQETAPLAKGAGTHWPRRLAIGGMAAAAVAAAVVVPWTVFSTPPPAASASANRKPQSGIVLVKESGRINSMSDEGWREDSDGSAMRALRLKVVEENSLMDEETGIVMQVTEPREELLLMPVSAF